MEASEGEKRMNWLLRDHSLNRLDAIVTLLAGICIGRGAVLAGLIVMFVGIAASAAAEVLYEWHEARSLRD
jgi:hypothetical protein